MSKKHKAYIYKSWIEFECSNCTIDMDFDMTFDVKQKEFSCPNCGHKNEFEIFKEEEQGR